MQAWKKKAQQSRRRLLHEERSWWSSRVVTAGGNARDLLHADIKGVRIFEPKIIGEDVQ